MALAELAFNGLNALNRLKVARLWAARCYTQAAPPTTRYSLGLECFAAKNSRPEMPTPHKSQWIFFFSVSWLRIESISSSWSSTESFGGVFKHLFKISIREGHKAALHKVLWCKRRSSSGSNIIFIGFSVQIVLRGPQKSLKCKRRQAFCCKRHSIESLPQNTQDVRI